MMLSSNNNNVFSFFNIVLAFIVVMTCGIIETPTTTLARLQGSHLKTEEAPYIVPSSSYSHNKTMVVAEEEEVVVDYHHRKLGSWQTYHCNSLIGKVDDPNDMPKEVSCASAKSSAVTKTDAKNLAKLLCCGEGIHDGYKIKSYKTVFGTTNWYYKCCQVIF